MFGACTDDGFNAKALEFCNRQAVFEVGFISNKNDRFFTFESLFSNIAVIVTRILAAVDDNKNNICCVCGFGDLLLNGGFELIVRVFEASRVYEPKLMVLMFYFAQNVVTRGACFSGNDCLLRLDKSVKKRTFANVRLTNDCYSRKFTCHEV